MIPQAGASSAWVKQYCSLLYLRTLGFIVESYGAHKYHGWHPIVTSCSSPVVVWRRLVCGKQKPSSGGQYFRASPSHRYHQRFPILKTRQVSALLSYDQDDGGGGCLLFFSFVLLSALLLTGIMEEDVWSVQ